MTFRYWLLALVLIITLTTGCARRNRAKKSAESTRTEAARTPEEIRRENALDLASIMADELQLREDQTLRVRQVLRTTVEQVNQAQTQHGANKTALTAALRRINASSESQLKSIMTAAQYQQYQQRKPQIQQRLREQKANAN